MSHIPNVDLTDAARAYGLSYVPPVVHTFDDDLLAVFRGATHAAFAISENRIHVWPDLFQDPDEYDEERFERAGAGRLSYPDSAKFVLAHELWHARQDEINGDEAEWAEARAINSGAKDHDSAQSEIEADLHAAQVYQLVKIGD